MSKNKKKLKPVFFGEIDISNMLKSIAENHFKQKAKASERLKFPRPKIIQTPDIDFSELKKITEKVKNLPDFPIGFASLDFGSGESKTERILSVIT